MKSFAQRRQTESEALKKRIRKAALNLFLRDGIENVTMRKIAAKIRYSPATIYNYYKNKDEIFLALRQEGFAKFQGYQEKSRKHRSPRKRILAHGRAYLEFAVENPELYDLMFLIKAPMEAVTSDANRPKTQRSIQLLRDDIVSCMESGVLRKGPKKRSVDTVALAFWAVGHGLASLLIRQRLHEFGSTDQERLISQTADYLYDSLISATKQEQR
jgi:AcrR family transcriptional regulator